MAPPHNKSNQNLDSLFFLFRGKLSSDGNTGKPYTWMYIISHLKPLPHSGGRRPHVPKETVGHVTQKKLVSRADGMPKRNHGRHSISLRIAGGIVVLLMLANSYMVDGFSLIGGVGNRRLPICAAESKSAPLRGSVFAASSPALPLRTAQSQRDSVRTVLTMTQDGGKPPGSEPLDGGDEAGEGENVPLAMSRMGEEDKEIGAISQDIRDNDT